MEFCDEKSIVPARDLSDLVEKLNEVFAHDVVNVEYVKTLMSSYVSEPMEWEKYAKFDPHRYTRNLVSEGNGKYNLMVLCWNESQGSAIHDHADAHCFMKVLDGNIQETLYTWPLKDKATKKSSMQTMRCSKYNIDEVAYICDEMGLHRVENPSHTDTAVTLHLYSPPFDECHCFDENTCKKRKVKVTFWSKYGEKTPFNESPSSASVDFSKDNPPATVSG